MVVVAAAIGIGVADVLQMMRIEVIDYIFRKNNLVFGCCASIATSSMMFVLAKGKTLEEALNITQCNRELFKQKQNGGFL